MIVRSPVSMRQLSYLLKYSHHCSSAAYDAVMQTGILQGPPDTAQNTDIPNISSGSLNTHYPLTIHISTRPLRKYFTAFFHIHIAEVIKFSFLHF